MIETTWRIETTSFSFWEFNTKVKEPKIALRLLASNRFKIENCLDSGDKRECT